MTMPKVMMLLLVERFKFFKFIAATSHFLVDFLAQQTGRLDEQHDDQHQEDDGVRQLGRYVSLAEVLDDAQQDAADAWRRGWSRCRRKQPPRKP